MTQDGLMRHPSFEGLRDDKKSKTVVMEKPKRTTELVKNNNRKPNGRKLMGPGKKKLP